MGIDILNAGDALTESILRGLLKNPKSLSY